ncbi:hypothetical protein HanPI659440_Chr04g0138981 [Helianthus annuus]|nr:hypothetical protein HanPI659440_Chr04g0138981 [Helianthus annuus]
MRDTPLVPISSPNTFLGSGGRDWAVAALCGSVWKGGMGLGCYVIWSCVVVLLVIHCTWAGLRVGYSGNLVRCWAGLCLVWAGGIRGWRVDPICRTSWCYLVACLSSPFLWSIGWLMWIWCIMLLRLCLVILLDLGQLIDLMLKAAKSWLHHVWKHLCLNDHYTLHMHKTSVLRRNSRSLKAEVNLSCLHISGQNCIYQVRGVILWLILVLDSAWKCDSIIMRLMNLALIVFLLSGRVNYAEIGLSLVLSAVSAATTWWLPIFGKVWLQQVLLKLVNKLVIFLLCGVWGLIRFCSMLSAYCRGILVLLGWDRVYGMMYLQAQARWLLICCGTRFGTTKSHCWVVSQFKFLRCKSVYICMVYSCWKFLVQAKCGNNLSTPIRLYVIWVKAKYCIRSLIMSIMSVWRIMVRVGAAFLSKDQMQSILRAGGLRSKISMLLETCSRFLLVKKTRPIFNHVGQGVINMLQASGWIIKGYNHEVKKGYGPENDKHIGHSTWGWGYWAVSKTWHDSYTNCVRKNHYGCNTMRHMHFKWNWAHRMNTSFCGPHLCFDTRWSDSVSVKASCKFGLISPCKARFLFIPSVGSMISYFWSPKLVLEDVTGGMPP